MKQRLWLVVYMIRLLWEMKILTVFFKYFVMWLVVYMIRLLWENEELDWGFFSYFVMWWAMKIVIGSLTMLWFEMVDYVCLLSFLFCLFDCVFVCLCICCGEKWRLYVVLRMYFNFKLRTVNRSSNMLQFAKNIKGVGVE